MAPYATIPKDEAEPLVAAAPKAASPKFKAAALAICLTSAVAGYQAPSAAKSLSGKSYEGILDYVLTQKLCIGPPTGKLSKKEAVAVKSDTCNTKYTVKYL